MRNRQWTIAILLLACAVASYNPVANLVFAARMALALRNLASGATGENLPVQVTKVQRRMGDRTVEALVYRPNGSSPSRAIIFMVGVSEQGCYHPRLMALCRYLADKGFLVVTPDITMFRQLEISAEPIDQIVYWFHQARTLDGGQRVEHIGLAGISFSATLSLIAAARPEIRDEVAFLIGIGPYYDLHRCFRAWFSSGPVTVGEGYYPTRFYAKWIIMNAALGMLPVAQDRQFLHGVLLDLLLGKKVPPADPALTPEGQRWYRLAVMREDQSDEELSQKIESYLTPILFRQLEPAQAAAEIRCPVFLLHGAYDDLIPPEESREMQQHITRARCYLLISPFLTHTHPLEKPFTWRQKAAALADSFAFFYRLARILR